MVGDLYDFHSHILPGMDDGFADVRDAVQALKLSYEQGVRYVVATPHFYPEETVDTFLCRRAEAYDRLKREMEKDGGSFPEICLGAEVYYYPNISYNQELKRLCIGNSRYLLLELPFRLWGVEVLRDVQNICNTAGLTPVLAHIERYFSLQNRRSAAQMLSLELPMQVNTEFILERRTRRLARKILQDDGRYLLGTDCHNLTDRKPEMGPALEKLKDAALEWVVERAMDLSEDIWKQAMA